MLFGFKNALIIRQPKESAVSRVLESKVYLCFDAKEMMTLCTAEVSLNFDESWIVEESINWVAGTSISIFDLHLYLYVSSAVVFLCLICSCISMLDLQLYLYV